MAHLVEAASSAVKSTIAALVSRLRPSSNGTAKAIATSWMASIGIAGCVSYLLARNRLLPSIVLRTAFCVNLGWTMTLANVQIVLLQACAKVGVLTPKNAAGLSAATTAWWCGVHRILSPHVHLTMLPGSLEGGVAAMPRPHLVLLNHTTFFDVILFLWTIKPSYMRVMKTFYKVQLEKVPLLGRILTSSDMLPVYFIRDHHEEFRVDRQKQEAVLEATKEHLANNGCISFFPEGGINRRDVRRLLPFRLGTFQRAIERRLDLYYMLHVGGSEVWPMSGCVLGGFPVNVYLFYGKIDVDYDDPTLDAKRLTEIAQDTMQQRLDWMFQYVDQQRASVA